MTNETTQQPAPAVFEIAQQVSILNARITNANLANNDMLREMDNTFKALVAKIDALQKENAELKAKSKEAPKS